LRILVITNMYPPHHLGGYELSCRDSVTRWREHGNDVVVLTSGLRFPDVTAGEEPDVHRDLAFYWRDHEIISPGPARRFEMERRNQRTLANLLDTFRPDVVSAWHMGAMSLGLLTSVVERRVPLVLVVCDEWPTYAAKVDAWLRMSSRIGPLARLVTAVTGLPTRQPKLEHATWCFVSDFIKQKTLEGAPWKPSIATVTYSGIDTKDFPTTARQEHEWRSQLLCVGRIDERKGIHVALEAVSKLSGATLTVSGRGDEAYLRRLHERANALGLTDRVRFIATPRSELKDVYAAADAFLFPVLWDEPFGLTPVEAMACGTPVIASVAGGSSEFLIDGANCIEVPRGDPDALAAAVRRLRADDDLRRRIVAGGYATAEELSVDRYASALEEWHSATADRFASGRPADRRSIRSVLAARGLVAGR
jgi:glycosyltransferase involved in cell wall biosynthesis